jgi:hypothetical protein
VDGLAFVLEESVVKMSAGLLFVTIYTLHVLNNKGLKVSTAKEIYYRMEQMYQRLQVVVSNSSC